MVMTATMLDKRRSMEHAHEVRLARAGLKLRINREGRRAAAEVIEEPPEFAQSMLVADVLMAAPRVGPMLSRRWLVSAGVDERATLRWLTVAQRMSLAAMLRGQS